MNVNITNISPEKKVLIFSAPSGAGKTTVVKHLLSKYQYLDFSVSATSRDPRGEEKNGREYFFISKDVFQELIKKEEFIEYEEVYSGTYYGTLKSELERIWAEGKIIVFDIDVKGGVNLKKMFGNQALAIFVSPPSVEALKERLIARGTENQTAIEKRVSKAKEELSYSKFFDYILVNDNLEKCLIEAEELIEKFRSNSNNK
jgi:guanylate kinase